VEKSLKSPTEVEPAEPPAMTRRSARPASRTIERPEAALDVATVAETTRIPRERPRRASRSPAEAADRPASASVEPAAHTIDLDLGRSRQRFALEGAPEERYRVASVEGCPAAYDIESPGGSFGRRSAATIVIAGRREVRLKVTLDMGPRGAAIVIEPLVSTDHGKDIPFTLANMENIRKRVMKQGNAAAGELAAIEAEGSRLMAWINAPVAKPLGEVGQAKARVVALEQARVRQTSAVNALEADLAVAEAMEKLARQLHSRCRLGISKSE
jgi:hypothetical protein